VAFGLAALLAKFSDATFLASASFRTLPQAAFSFMACLGAQTSGGTHWTYCEKALPFKRPSDTMAESCSRAFCGTWDSGKDCTH